MWYGQDVMRYKLLYKIIMFCWSYRQLAKALWLSLYCIRCKCQIIALLYRYAIAIVAKAIVGEKTMWWHVDKDQDDGDHGVMPVTMEIMTVLWRWRSKAQDDDGHIMSHIFHCMWCLSFMHLILLSTTVALWDDPSLKFQGISVLPEYAPLRQFFVLRHHVMIGCDKLYVHIQRVQASFAHAEILGLNLTSLAYADMASEHWD